jgi:hypothetical protein
LMASRYSEAVMRTSYDFYATGADLLDLLRAFEEGTPVRYALAGAFNDERAALAYESAATIPKLGIATRPSRLLDRHFLVLPRDIPLRSEPKEQQAGGTLFYVDGARNPEAIGLSPGGLFHNTCLTEGCVGMNNFNLAARRLFKTFARLLRKRFTRVGDTYVGPEALAMLKKGLRLAYDADADQGRDLQLQPR